MTNDNKVKILRVKDIMERMGVGRRTAERMLADKRCPTLPRVPHGPLMVTEEGWEAFLAAFSKVDK